jgi:hypothetical protein
VKRLEKRYLSVPVQYSIIKKYETDDTKIPVELLVMHDQINANSSNFDFSVIDSDTTKESIKNIPILGYIRKVDGSDTKDFAGHEVEISFNSSTGNITYTYLERPLGCLPETNNYGYVEKDGKKYVKVTGYLWREYLNEAYGVLQENSEKSISMEIVVDDYSIRADGIVDIKAYRYLGVTILGESVSPAMAGANMQVVGQFSNDQKFSQEFHERVEKLNYELKNKPTFKIDSYFISQEEAEKLVQKANSIFAQFGFECSEYIVDGKEYQITGIINKTLNKEASEAWGFDIYDKDTITIYSLDFEKIDSASISVSSVELLMNKNLNTNQQHFTLKMKKDFNEGGEKDKLPQKKEVINLENNLGFSATYKQKREAIDNALDPIITRNEDGDIISEICFYLDDFDDKNCLVEKYTWTDSNREEEYGRFTYSFDETNIIATITSEFEKLIKTALTQEEYDKVMADRAEFETLKTKSAEFELTINTLTTENTNLKTKNEELTSYQNTKEKEIHTEAINQVFTQFDEELKENKDYVDFKEKVNADVMKYSVELVDEKLNAIFGKVQFTKTNKKKVTEKISAIVIEGETEVKGSRYGKYEKYVEK